MTRSRSTSKEFSADLDEIKRSLNSISKEIGESRVERKEDNKIIKSLATKIEKLENMLKEKDDKIKNLESRVEDLEQYTRQEDIIITGMKVVRPLSDVVRGDSEMDRKNVVEEQVLEKLNSHGIALNEQDISACHTLGPRRDDGTQKIIVRFVSRKTKVTALVNARKLKGTGIYLNEHLTSKNAGIAKSARDLRKSGKLMSTWTRGCKVYVKTNDGRVLMVRSTDELSQL